MSKSVDEFIGELQEFGRRATDLSDILTGIGQEITADLKAKAPKGKTGNLTASISFQVTQDSLALEMLDYGVFQNYGVNGTDENANTEATETDFVGSFGTIPKGHTFQFKKQTIGGSLPFPVRRSIAERGLNRQKFFDVNDLIAEVALRIEEEINTFE